MPNSVAHKLHNSVVERYQQAQATPGNSRDVALRTGQIVQEAQLRDPETGHAVRILPQRQSWLMQIIDPEGYQIGMPLGQNISYSGEPVKLLVERSRTQIALQDRLQLLRDASLKAICEILGRVVLPNLQPPSPSLQEALTLQHSLRKTPEGLPRPSVGMMAQALVQRSVDCHALNPRKGFIKIEQAPSFGGLPESEWVVRSQAYMGALDCSLELEAGADSRLTILSEADVLCNLTFNKPQAWETLDGSIAGNTLGALIEGTDVVVLDESTEAGFTHLAPHSLGRLQEILANSTPVPY